MTVDRMNYQITKFEDFQWKQKSKMGSDRISSQQKGNSIDNLNIPVKI